MKTMLAAATALSLGVGFAYADGGVPRANTMSTRLPGGPMQASHASTVAPTPNKPVVQDPNGSANIEVEHSTAKTAIGNIH